MSKSQSSAGFIPQYIWHSTLLIFPTFEGCNVFTFFQLVTPRRIWKVENEAGTQVAGYYKEKHHIHFVTFKVSIIREIRNYPTISGESRTFNIAS